MSLESGGKDGEYGVEEVKEGPCLIVAPFLWVVEAGERAQHVEQAVEAAEVSEVILDGTWRGNRRKMLPDQPSVVYQNLDIGIVVVVSSGGGKGNCSRRNSIE